MNVAYLRAALLVEQDHYEQAEREVRQALLESPDDARSHSLLALCLVHREAYADATREAELAVHLAPDDAHAHYMLANILYCRNRFKEAQRPVDEAVRIDPHNANTWALRASIFGSQGAWAKSLDSAEQGLAGDAEDVNCNNLRAIAMVKLGRKSEAGATIDAALSRNPDDALTHANKGWALLEHGERVQAMEHFRESLRLEPNLEWARLGIIEALKARHLLYGLLLKYFLWMSKLSGRAQWGVVLGGFLGFRFLNNVARTYPDLAVWILPLQLVYVAFVVLTWLANPLFNLMLRLNRFGRLVLSDEERAASNLIGGSLLFGILSLIAALIFDSAALLLAGGALALLTLPLSAIHRCDSGWPRLTMTAYVALLAMAAMAAVAAARYYPPLMAPAASVFMLGIFAGMFVANLLMMARVKH